jgi:hypothetical protein
LTRQPISKPCQILIRKLSPSRQARLDKCRSMPFKMLGFEGERIHLEFDCPDEISRRRAKQMRRCIKPESISIAGALLGQLAISLSQSRISFDAVMLWMP